MNNKKIFKAGMYVRLSKEDSNKVDLESESNSIINQKSLIESFIDNQDDIELSTVRIDDGFTGTNFERQGFLQLLDDIETKRIDCVIVKDLSRLGRNFAQTGKYMRDIFSKKGIRFIAINDNVDTAIKDDDGNNIVVTFKNLINETVSSDISSKVRSSLEVKRKQGDHTSGSPSYGYIRNPQDKSKLVIDELAQPIVIDIFSKAIEGMTCIQIANFLNSKNILTPDDHKKFLKSNPNSNLEVDTKYFKNYDWNNKTVTRILQNDVYIGTLTQGRVTTPNYKVRKARVRPKDEWVITQNSHEPIISKELFYEVQKILQKEVRTSKSQKQVLKLSGIVFCNDCGSPMTRKNNGSKSKPHYSYVCSNHNNKRGCETSHSISESLLEQSLIYAIKMQIKKIKSFDNFINSEENKSYVEMKKAKYTITLEETNAKYHKLLDKNLQVYDDYKNDLLDKDEYIAYKSNYEKLANEKLQELYSIEKVLSELEVGVLYEVNWLNKFKESGTIENVDRKFIISLVEQIFICDDKSLIVDFRFENEINNIQTFISNKNEPLEKEVV